MTSRWICIFFVFKRNNGKLSLKRGVCLEGDFRDPDERMVHEFLSGNADAFAEILERYKNLVLNVAYRFLQDRTEAEDVTQDVFLNVYRSAKTYKPRAKFSTWVYKITANICLNRLRDKKEFPKADLKSDCLLNPSSRLSPPEELERKELQKIVKTALMSLPSSQRMAVILKKYQGLSYHEIAEVMSCSIPAVESLLQRAKNNLRETLRPFL